MGAVAVVGTAYQRGEWLQFALLLVHYTFIAVKTMTKTKMVAGSIHCEDALHDGHRNDEKKGGELLKRFLLLSCVL